MKIELPKSEYPLLIRTHFLNDKKWENILNLIKSPLISFDAVVTIIDDKQFEGLAVSDLPQFEVDQEEHDFIFLADEESMAYKDSGVLCINLAENFGASFRALPNCIAEVSNNLFMVNCDFEDFQNATDPDRVYRGS
jgi:hypothetical protein